VNTLRHALFCICGHVNGGHLPKDPNGYVRCPNCNRDLVEQLGISEFGGG